MAEGPQLTHKRNDIRHVIRNFTPAWFVVTMGTGAISVLFHVFPYATGTKAMTVLTYLFFFLNFLLFVLFTLISISRYVLFPDVWIIMLRNPLQSLFLGCFPMGFTTLINVAVTLINHERGYGGKPFLYTLWGLWWLDMLLSFFCCCSLVHIMASKQKHSLEQMTAVWLLPVLPLIVSSVSGGVLAEALLKEPLHALITVTVSAFMVAIGLSLALMIMTMYFLRLIVYGHPEGATVTSVFLPLGAASHAGYSFLLIGRSVKVLLPLEGSAPDHILGSSLTGDVCYVACVCMAFALWALGSIWLFLALLGAQEVLRGTRIPFAVPFWGIIFPNGVYANLTIVLSTIFDSKFLRVYGACYSVFTLLLWLTVATLTILRPQKAQLFDASCSEDVTLVRCGTDATKCDIEEEKRASDLH